MLSLSDCTLTDVIYTFVADDGTNIHVNSTKLRAWCLRASLEIFDVPIEAKVAEQFVLDNSVSLARTLELLNREDPLDPIIYIKSGTETNGAPDVMLADGHHRYYLAHMMKLPLIPAFILELPQWKPFQILSPLLEITREELRAIPPALGRTY